MMFKCFQTPEEKEALLLTDEYQEQMSESTFLFLTLDLPTAPLYKDEKEQLIIPQVPLFNILGKFNGSTEKVTTVHQWFNISRVHNNLASVCTPFVVLNNFKLEGMLIRYEHIR